MLEQGPGCGERLRREESAQRERGTAKSTQQETLAKRRIDENMRHSPVREQRVRRAYHVAFKSLKSLLETASSSQVIGMTQDRPDLLYMKGSYKYFSG